MSFKKTLVVSFHSIEIVDWYDGVFHAFAFTESEIYFLVLVKWQIAFKKKTFLLLRLNNLNFETFRFYIEEDEKIKEGWEKYEIAFKQFIDSYQEKVYIINQEPEVNKVYNCIMGNLKDYLLVLKEQDIQKTIV